MSVKHVVFGTGAIGRAIMEEILRRDENVRMVNRSGKMAEAPTGVEIIAADLYDPANVRKVASGAQVVYQAAQPAYHEWPEKFPPLQQAIIDGLAGSQTKLVIVENLYIYGEAHGSLITEALPYDSRTRKGKTRSEMSKAALAAHQQGKVKVTIGRGSDYFGPWGTDSSMGGRTFYPLLKGKAAQIAGRVDLPHTYTYTKDFGKALVILGEREEAEGQAWHVPNDSPRITQGELVKMFAEEACVPLKISTMGKFMMRLGGLFIPAAKEAVEMMYEFDQPFVVDSSKFENTFGMRATPIREAIRTTAAWYTSHAERGN